MINSSKYENEEKLKEIRYEDNPEFNEYLDETYPIDIGGIALQASEVLFEMDLVAYEEMLNEFKEKQDEDFKNIVYNEFPLPIAYNFYRCNEGFESPIQRLHLLKDTWESLIFILFAIVMGEVRHCHLSLDKELHIHKGNVFSDRLDTKLQIIERILQFAFESNYNLTSLKLIPIETIAEIRELNRQRNSFSHSGALSNFQAEGLFYTLFPDVLNVLKKLSNLKDINFLRYRSSAGRMNRINCEIFSGYAMTRTIKQLEIEPEQLSNLQQLNQNNLLFYFKGTMYSVLPFMYFKEESSGHQTNICFLKQKSRRKISYEILGKTETYELDESEFSNEINELCSLISGEGLK